MRSVLPFSIYSRPPQYTAPPFPASAPRLPAGRPAPYTAAHFQVPNKVFLGYIMTPFTAGLRIPPLFRLQSSPEIGGFRRDDCKVCAFLYNNYIYSFLYNAIEPQYLHKGLVELWSLDCTPVPNFTMQLDAVMKLNASFETSNISQQGH